MKTLTASNRSSLIKLASRLPQGDEARRAVLASLQKQASLDTSTIHSLEELHAFLATNSFHTELKLVTKPDGFGQRESNKPVKVLEIKEAGFRKLFNFIGKTWPNAQKDYDELIHTSSNGLLFGRGPSFFIGKDAPKGTPAAFYIRVSIR